MKWNIDNTKDVWKLATKLHEGQKYGGTQEGEQVDYINHVGSVTFEVIAALPHHNDIDEDLAVKCAMLHDTIEDTNFTYEEAEKRFGKKVADGVMALTKNESLEGKRAKMLDSLKRIKQQPKAVWMVKIADRITNLYTVPYYWNTEKKKAYRVEAQLILDELGEASPYLAKRLEEKIEAYKHF